MFTNRNIIILLGVLVFLLIIILLIKLPSKPSKPVVSPSPQVTPVASTNPTPPSYSINNLKNDYQRIANPQPLSVSDLEIRKKLISSLGNKSGVLNQTSAYKIKYVKSPNQFMIEISDNNADLTKSQAQKWFNDQGLSVSGVCNLPVVFYLNFEVNNYYKQNNLQFNPIPDGC